MNPRRSFKGARCLVTGASSPPGRAIAEFLALEGASVLLTDRSLERLEAIARGLVDEGAEAGSILAVDADLDEVEGRGKLIHAAASRLGALDLAINAAGAVEIDNVALAQLTRELLTLLRLGDRPALVDLGEAAIDGFTGSIRAECSKFGIQILRVAPGPTATETATRTLAAIRRADPKPPSTLGGRLLSLLDRLTGLGQGQTTTRMIPASSTRLPRPHFGLRIPQPSKKGD
jgi:short-subunit dehydrogenase